MKITSCVFGILVRDHKILLVKNLYREFGPIWGIPGGKQNPYETIHDTVIREFKEETLLQIKVGRLVTILERIQPDRPFHLIAPVFEVFSDDLPQIPARDSIIDFHFFSAEEIAHHHETIMNRQELFTFLKKPESLSLWSNLPPALDAGPLQRP